MSQFKNYQIVTIWCDNESTCGNIIKYSDLTTSLRYIYQMSYYYKYLVIVDAHPKVLKSMDTFIRVFDASFDDSKHTASYTYTHQINTVQSYGEYVVKTLLHYHSSSTNPCYTYILGLMSNGVLRIFNSALTYKVSLNVYQEILNAGGEIIQKEFNDFYFTDVPTYTKQTTYAHMIFTSQSLNYKFRLVYDTYNYKLASFTYHYALSRYYDAQTLPGMWIDNYSQIAIIPYRQNDKNISIFELPDNSVVDKRMVYSYGGISEYHDFTDSDRVSCTVQNNVAILGVSSKFESNMFYIKHYNVNLQQKLIVDNTGGNLLNQIGSLEVSNTINSEQLQFNIKILSSEQKEENSQMDSNETDIKNQTDYLYI